jgi:hypothetical protein
MLPPIAALATFYLLAPGADAQTTNTTTTTTAAAASTDRRYVVWSSAIFTRTGERTPELLSDIPPQLTSFGAHQAYAAGHFFRTRYTNLRNGTNGDESAGAELIGLNANLYSQNQVTTLALEQQYNLATQQAFMQGLYPPISLGSSISSGGVLNPVDLLANDTYVSSIRIARTLPPSRVVIDRRH